MVVEIQSVEAKMKAFQYIYLDNQQVNYPMYRMTERHFSSSKAWRKKYNNNGENSVMFRLIGPYRPSKLEGQWAERVTSHERK